MIHYSDFLQRQTSRLKQYPKFKFGGDLSFDAKVLFEIQWSNSNFEFVQLANKSSQTQAYYVMKLRTSSPPISPNIIGGNSL